jgi:hypothetical protein
MTRPSAQLGWLHAPSLWSSPAAIRQRGPLLSRVSSGGSAVSDDPMTRVGVDVRAMRRRAEGGMDGFDVATAQLAQSVIDQT